MILKSAKYWIYAEAQIIDGVLVGSFAAFANENNKATLAAIVVFCNRYIAQSDYPVVDAGKLPIFWLSERLCEVDSVDKLGALVALSLSKGGSTGSPRMVFLP